VPLERQIEIFQRWIDAPDDVTATRDGYLEMLETYRGNVAAAISAVAGTSAGGVLVHCMGGKDRTGLVAALLLRLAGVSVADIAADYGLSAENIKPLWQVWVEDAGDENERELRRRLSASPAEAMAQVLETLERERGSVRQYLLDAGASEKDWIMWLRVFASAALVVHVPAQPATPISWVAGNPRAFQALRRAFSLGACAALS
jgi:hypothetical protein